MLQATTSMPLFVVLVSFAWMLACPLCGRLCPLHHFNPGQFEDDIVIQKVHGLGRGKGFRTAEARSVFERDGSTSVQHATKKICDRVLEILAMLLGNDFITPSEIAERLGLGSDLAVEVVSFLQLDSVEEFLYDADLETQKLAREIMRKARQSAG